MATVLENYRIAVRVSHPRARCKAVEAPYGRGYQIVDGEIGLGEPEIDGMTAWRETGKLLGDAREAKRLEAAMAAASASKTSDQL